MKNGAKWLLWALTLCWTGVIFRLSGQSADQSAQLSGGLTQWVLQMFSFLNLPGDALEHILRKLAHFCMFGLEGFLLYLSLRLSLRGRGAFGLSAAGCALIAVLTEYQQTFFEGRSGELRDVFIDSAGALTGILAAMLCYYLIKSRRRA